MKPYSFCANIARSSVITSLPVKVLRAPQWFGILHDLLVGSQNFPRLCLCRGQTHQFATSSSFTSNIPDLAKISVCSDKLSLDKWYAKRWLFTSSLHVLNFTRDVFPRDSPQVSSAWKQTLAILHVCLTASYILLVSGFSFYNVNNSMNHDGVVFLFFTALTLDKDLRMLYRCKSLFIAIDETNQKCKKSNKKIRWWSAISCNTRHDLLRQVNKIIIVQWTFYFFCFIDDCTSKWLLNTRIYLPLTFRSQNLLKLRNNVNNSCWFR